MEKWNRRFEKAIVERKEYKRAVMSTEQFSVLNSNDNLDKNYDWERTL